LKNFGVSSNTGPVLARQRYSVEILYSLLERARKARAPQSRMTRNKSILSCNIHECGTSIVAYVTLMCTKTRKISKKRAENGEGKRAGKNASITE
jgi:hypothetical protein